MARRKSIAQLQAQLTAAQKRAEYYAVPHPPDLTKPITRRPRETVLYPSMYTDVDDPNYLWNCNKVSLEKFGGIGPLKLRSPGIAANERIAAPNNFRPAEIHGHLPDSPTPERVKAKASGATYVRYAPGTPYGENPQFSFSAPIAGADKTPKALLDNFTAVVGSASFTPGSQFYLTLERFPYEGKKPVA